jgi:O-antigen/teichoic acid export membrane protein
LGRDAYLESYKYVGPLAFAFMLSSFSFLPEFQITMSKETKYTSAVYVLKFLIFALLGSILIVNYGVAGVLLTYVVTNGLALIAHIRIGQRLYPIDSGILGWVASAFLAVVLYLGTAYLLPAQNTIDVVTVAWKALVFLLLAGLVSLIPKLRFRHFAMLS